MYNSPVHDLDPIDSLAQGTAADLFNDLRSGVLECAQLPEIAWEMTVKNLIENIVSNRSSRDWVMNSVTAPMLSRPSPHEEMLLVRMNHTQIPFCWDHNWPRVLGHILESLWDRVKGNLKDRGYIIPASEASTFG